MAKTEPSASLTTRMSAAVVTLALLFASAGAAQAAGGGERPAAGQPTEMSFIRPGTTPPAAWAAYDPASKPELQPVGANALPVIMQFEQILDDLDADNPSAFIGVLAYHQVTREQYAKGVTNDIVRVGIRCDDGPEKVFTGTVISPVTGAPVYGGWIRAVDFKDGPHECRAIGTPTNGTPISRVISFNTNAQGTLKRRKRYVCQSGYAHKVYGAIPAGADTNPGTSPRAPKATIWSAKESLRTSGGLNYTDIEIVCPGAYDWTKAAGEPDPGDGNTWWNRIYGSPSIARDDVVIAAPGVVHGPNYRNIRLSHLKVATCLTNRYRGARLWLDNVLVVGPVPWPNAPATYDPKCGTWWRIGDGGQFTGGRVVSNSEISYVTDACTNCSKITNSFIHHVTNDTFNRPGVVINVRVENADRGAGRGHPDLLAATAAASNGGVVYGLTAKVNIKSQILFSDGKPGNERWSNTAWDNLDVASAPGFVTWNLSGINRNLFVRNSRIAGSVYFGNTVFEQSQLVNVVTPQRRDYGYKGDQLSILNSRRRD